jgi:hypothetical protein
VADLESRIAKMMRARGYMPSAPLRAPGPIRKATLALRHRLGMWRFGVRNYGAVPFFGVRLANRLRLRSAQRYFQRRIDTRIREMLR